MNYKIKVMRIVKYTLILLFVFVLGVFTPYYQFFAGLVLGGAVSLLNTYYTSRKIDRMGEIASQLGEDSKTRYMSTGMLTRIAMAVLTVIVAMPFPEHFNLYTTIFGLFTAQLISVVDSIIHKI
jgi:ATP synthase protein I